MPNLLLACLGLEALNVILNVATIVLILVTAASDVNPELASEMTDAGIKEEDVPTIIWGTAVIATCIYVMATGTDSIVQ